MQGRRTYYAIWKSEEKEVRQEMMKYVVVGDNYQDVHNLEWTTDVPEEPGWYWAKKIEGGKEIVNIDSWNGSVYEVGKNGYSLKSYFSHWIGPIPEPDDP